MAVPNSISIRATNPLALNANVRNKQQGNRIQLTPPRSVIIQKKAFLNGLKKVPYFPDKRANITAPVAFASAGTEAASAVNERTANSLDSVKVLNLNGDEVVISDLWKDRKAVVAFARHFGCVLCRKRADYLAAHKDKMDEAGVALVLIGPGNVDQARSFAEQTKFKGEIYADPDRSSYNALDFVYGVTRTFTPGAGLKIIQAYMEGYRQDWKLSFEKETRTKGGWQQGGIIVAGPGKYNISYIHKDKEAGDDPEIEEILRACCA